MLVITFTLFLLFFDLSKSAQLCSALYKDYALVGMLPASSDPSKFSYVALLNRHDSNSAFQITSVFHLDDTAGFGASVALGAAMGDGLNTVIAAVGSKVDTGDISIFDVQSNCSTEGCSPWITYQTTGSKGSCTSGSTVVAGNSFVASSCPSNLLRKRSDHQPGPPSAFTVCTISDLYTQKCELLHDVPLEVQVCNGKGGQLVINAMDARGEMLVIAFCAVCAVESGNTLSIRHYSGYAVYRISAISVSPVFVGYAERSLSCPSSIAVNDQWVIIGYSDEGGVDFYSTANTTFNYTLQLSFDLDTPIGYGAYVDCDDTLVIVSGKGELAQLSYGSANIYGIGQNGTANFTEQLLMTSIPCINYPVQFNYTFAVNLYEGTIFVVTQDITSVSWGFDAFTTCPFGMGWSATKGRCDPCPRGQHKQTDRNQGNFDLCIPCKGGSYSNTTKECAAIECPSGFVCPAGSPTPIFAAPKFAIDSYPSPQATDPLDFENTFYFSCYPYFVLFLTAIIAIAIPVCCTWPKKTDFQKNLVTRLLFINFFYWPEGDEENFFMDEPKIPLLTSINGDLDEDEQREKLNDRRRMHIDQFIGSLCSYFVAATFFLMIVFGIAFVSHGDNTSIEIDLQTLDQSFLVENDTYVALNEIDQSPFSINVLLMGYNGECIPEEISFQMSGCYAIDFQAPCKYNLTVMQTNDNDTSNCSVTAEFLPSNLQQQASFAIGFTKLDFYAQQIIYNVSTTNDETMTYKGNAFVAGSFLPVKANILRGNITVELLSILTYIGDCESVAASTKLFVPDLIRASITNCTPNELSYKSLSFLSSYSDEINLVYYNYLNSSGLTYNLLLTKSPFYKNVYKTFNVSFGTILNLIMFAALDVYWIVEAMCPFLGFTIFHIQSLIMSLTKKRG